MVKQSYLTNTLTVNVTDQFRQTSKCLSFIRKHPEQFLRTIKSGLFQQVNNMFITYAEAHDSSQHKR